MLHVTLDTFSSAMWASAHTGEKARDVIAHWRQAFAVLGIPSAVKTDNGPAYASQQVRQFLQLWGNSIKVVQREWLVSHILALLFSIETNEGDGGGVVLLVIALISLRVCVQTQTPPSTLRTIQSYPSCAPTSSTEHHQVTDDSPLRCHSHGSHVTSRRLCQPDPSNHSGLCQGQKTSEKFCLYQPVYCHISGFTNDFSSNVPGQKKNQIGRELRFRKLYIHKNKKRKLDSLMGKLRRLPAMAPGGWKGPAGTIRVRPHGCHLWSSLTLCKVSCCLLLFLLLDCKGCCTCPVIQQCGQDKKELRLGCKKHEIAGIDLDKDPPALYTYGQAQGLFKAAGDLSDEKEWRELGNILWFKLIISCCGFQEKVSTTEESNKKLKLNNLGQKSRMIFFFVLHFIHSKSSSITPELENIALTQYEISVKKVVDDLVRKVEGVTRRSHLAPLEQSVSSEGQPQLIHTWSILAGTSVLLLLLLLTAPGHLHLEKRHGMFPSPFCGAAEAIPDGRNEGYSKGYIARESKEGCAELPKLHTHKYHSAPSGADDSPLRCHSCGGHVASCGWCQPNPSTRPGLWELREDMRIEENEIKLKKDVMSGGKAAHVQLLGRSQARLAALIGSYLPQPQADGMSRIALPV
ncbi:hypothetical protein DV515_00013993 [Chloebia gouldiae]|uniref:Integrase catalytic domain-containing protein n=1 Tax=Chloebia gouldiae TaxID=44316 RepID=A0A3L8RZI4_CHLGU|nr:hypothetical protein DV515_00013993 [Chloebia gouldiae]